MKVFNLLKHLTFSFLAIWMIGCSSTRTYQKVNQVIYPEKRLPEQTHKIKVLHALPVKSLPNTLHNKPDYSSGDIKEVASDEFGVEGKPGYLINQTVRELRKGQFYLIEQNKLSENEVAEWGHNKVKNYLQNNQEALLVLAYLDSDYDFKSEKIKKHQLDQSGKDYYIDAYEASRNYVVQTEWNIYQGEPAGIIYKIKSHGEKNVKTQGLNKDQTIEKLDSIAEGIERFLLDSIAQILTSQILPRKMFDSWSYYVKGSGDLENGRKYMELDKLDEAEKIYLSGLRAPKDSKIEARLNYNLAVIHDILGHTSLAFNFAEKALLADDKYLHQNLYNELKLKKEISERS